MYVSQLVTIAVLCCGLVLALMPNSAQAYVDPGTTGMLSQLLYILFYGFLGVSLYCLRSIKQYLAKIFGPKVKEDDSPQNN